MKNKRIPCEVCRKVVGEEKPPLPELKELGFSGHVEFNKNYGGLVSIKTKNKRGEFPVCKECKKAE